jgi:hypothetical protein
MQFRRSFGMLSVLAVQACALGVEMGERRQPRVGLEMDASRDAGPERTGDSGQGGSGGLGRPAGTATGGGSVVSSDASDGADGNGGASSDADGSGGATGDAADLDDVRSDAPVVTDASCGSIQKFCDGRCVVAEPGVGCTLTSCDPCPKPPNSLPYCMGTRCDFGCLAGFLRVGAACVASDAGGLDGGHCVPSRCGDCVPLLEVPCCKPDNTCGCQPFFGGRCV